MQVRSADAAEIEHLARLWYDGWHRTHAPLVPPELTRLRTIESFHERLQAALPNVHVAGPLGAPIGFYALKGDELHLLFVSPEAHGSGIAAALIADAEARLAEHGVETAWLACAVGNDRAARFYDKSGWRLAGTFLNSAETSSGPFSLALLFFRAVGSPPSRRCELAIKRLADRHRVTVDFLHQHDFPEFAVIWTWISEEYCEIVGVAD
jgi:GNAT superfamily N-acetyltransferase